MAATIDFGIDLGTTNSCIARWEQGAVRVFQNNDQMNVTPSAVQLLKTGRAIVGRRAYAALASDPENVAIEFKRWMGQKDRKRFPAADRELSAEELSSLVLKALRDDVRRQTGTDVLAAVITVPAAFGALQCEATARAAQLAGLEESPLLQEPIAAAIGYGANAVTDNQRWLVFDLGGGTLDIAVVSTRDGRLNVLEHRGNNLLGGKDIDRAIVDRLFVPALRSSYRLSASVSSALLSELRTKAEEAKVDLSTEREVIVSLLDVGEDDDGRPIELEITVTRRELETLMEPLVKKCCALASEALAGSRVAAGDLDKILLVGGPTQSPLLRTMLGDQLGAPVDFSADPMTIVGRGAALYASTLERRATESAPPRGGLEIRLAFDPVCADRETQVAGRVVGNTSDIEVKIEKADSSWASEWLKLTGGIFETTVPLDVGMVTKFWVYARDLRGQLLTTDTTEFTIRQGLVPADPPLPHTLSVEILGPGGRPMLDPVFPKGTLLPAERTIHYRATSSLVPGRPESALPIKLWEGEYFDDPEANEWVGNVLLSHDGVTRPVAEGAEIEVTVSVNASRLIRVEALVTQLDERFGGHLYVAQREEQEFATQSQQVRSQATSYRARAEAIGRSLDSGADPSAGSQLTELTREIDVLEDKAARVEADVATVDPDDARRIVEEAKRVRGRLSELERHIEQAASFNPSRALALAEAAAQAIQDFGSPIDHRQLAALHEQLQQANGNNDANTVQRVSTEIEGLRWRVLFTQDWFWREIFESLCNSSVPFSDPSEAGRLIEAGTAAVAAGNGEALRSAVNRLWKLQPQGASDSARERAARSGLRRF